MKLERADGKQIPGYFNSFGRTAKDGSYKFRKIPPGRYLVVMNPYGPDSEWPYDLQYYPFGIRRDEARVFDVAAGQRLAGIDFRAPLLQDRLTQVRVTWANGTAAADASVCVTYEGGSDYVDLAGTNCVKRTDRDGLAVIHTCGRSQVRIFASQMVDRDDQRWFDVFRSLPLQSAADQTPDKTNLVLISRKR